MPKIKIQELKAGDLFEADHLNVWTEYSVKIKQVFGAAASVDDQPLILVKNHGLGVNRVGERYLLIEVLAPNGQLACTSLTETDEVRLITRMKVSEL